MAANHSPIPKDFFWRRLHSLMGLWLVIFLFEHLLTNSQSALVIGDDGGGFVKAVNFIKSLPYLPAIELTLLGVPFFVHIVWGIKYLLTAEPNSFAGDGTKPSMPEYTRNKAYTWQRITSWLLIIGVLAHVVQMRFIEYPASAKVGDEKYYMTRLSEDAGLYSLSKRLGVKIYDDTEVRKLASRLSKDNKAVTGFFKKMQDTFTTPSGSDARVEGAILVAQQEARQDRNYIEALSKRPLREGDVVAVTSSFGTAELLVVRDTFKSPLMIMLYTLFVLTAVYHAFNGFWTFLITWGVTLTEYSQLMMRRFAVFMMVFVGFLGLIAIWGTYWINLKM